MLGNDDDPSNEDQRYFVKRKSGKVFGPFDKNAIRMMLKADKIGPGASVSANKENWNPVSDIPAFADLIEGFDDGTDGDGGRTKTQMGGFGAVTRDADQPADASGADQPSGDAPLPQSKSAGTSEDDGPELPTPKSDDGGVGGGPDLPTSKGDGGGGDAGPDRPTPKGDDGGGPDLPTPKDDGPDDDGPGLPRPKGDDQEAPQPDLPAAKGSGDGNQKPDLPQSAAGAGGADDPAPPRSKGTNDDPNLPRAADADEPDDDLPTSARADLPESKGADDLPASKGEDNLPGDDQPDLPESKGRDNLPGDGQPDLLESKGRDNLPGNAQPDLPESKGEDNLPGGAEPDPPKAKGDDNLPDASEDEFEAEPLQPGGPEPDDDALSSPAPEDEDLFEEDDEDDLFEEDDDDGDLFAEEDEDDDLFSEEEEELFAEDDEQDDLFDDEEEDDLFGDEPGPEGGAGMESDQQSASEMSGEFGGEEPLELDDEGPATGATQSGQQPAAQSDGGQRSQGGQAGDSGSDDLELDQAAAADAGISTEERTRGGQARQPASPGAPSDAPQESEPTSKETDQQEGSSSSSQTIALAAVAVLLVAGAAVGGYMYLGDRSEPKKKKKTKTSKNKALDIDGLQQDTYTQFRSVLDGADPSKLSTNSRGKLLFTQSLYLARYDDADVRKRAGKMTGEFDEAEGGYPALGRGMWAASQGKIQEADKYLAGLREAKNETLGYYADLATGIARTKSLAPQGKEEKEKTYSASIPETARSPARGDHYTDDSGANDGDDGDAQANVGDDNDSGESAMAETTDNPDTGTAEEADAAKAASGSDSGGTDQADSGADREQRFNEARKALKAARDRRGNVAQPDYWLGQLRENENQATLALSFYENGVAKQNNHVPSRLRLAHLRYDSGNLQDAKKHVDKILSELGSASGAPDTAEAYHIEGLVHAARSESNKAIESFTKAINEDSSRSATLRKLAEAYEEAGKHKKALSFFKSNSAIDQDNPEVLLGIVRSHMGLEQWQDAINKLEAGEKKFPDDARFPYYLGRLHLERGAFSDARAAMERAVSLDATLLDAYGALAQLVWRLEQDPSTAEHYVQQAIKKPTRIDAGVATKIAGYYRMSDQAELAIKWYNEALRRDPNAWPARLSLAKIHLEEQQTDKALELLKSAREAGVQDIRLSAYLADAYRQSEQYDRALKAISKVIDQKPENAQYIFIRGQIRFDRGNFDTARRDFNKANELDPLFHRAYFYVGRTAFEQGDHKTALKIFRQVLDDQPEEGEYRYWMGRAFEAQGRTEDALGEYKKATDVDEEYARENPELFIRRGRLLVKLNRPENGRKEISRALEIDPGLIEARLAMAEADFSSKDYASAIENFQKALEESPENAKAQRKLGMALVYEDRKREGAEHLQKAIKFGYEDPEIYRTLGYLYKELDKRQLAIETFKSYLQETVEDDLPASTKREILNQINELGG